MLNTRRYIHNPLFIVACAGVALLCLTCYGVCANDVMAQYMKQDFSPVLSQCKVNELSMRPENGSLLLGDVLVKDLTDGERRFLSSYEYSDKVIIGIGKTLEFAITYAKQHNHKLPATGADIMLCHEDNYTEREYQNFAALSPGDKLVEACRGINPGTGRFVESFDNPEWHKFGVFLEPVDGDEAIQYFPEVIPGSGKDDGKVDTGMAPHQTWHVVVFGETPGRVLIDKQVWRQIGSPLEESAGPCGGCGKKKKKSN